MMSFFKKKNKVIFVLALLLIIFLLFKDSILSFLYPLRKVNPKYDVDTNYEINSNFIRNINKFNNSNYVISPYSMEIILNMLKDGSDKETYTNFKKIIDNRNISLINNNYYKNYNLLFINNQFDNYLYNSYIYNIKKKYKANILIDNLKNPKEINNIIKNKTNNKIKEFFNYLPYNTKFGLANINLFSSYWNKGFSCEDTKAMPFILNDNNIVDVEMMHNYYKANEEILVFNDENIKGVVLPFNNSSKMEFIAILPKIPLNDFIESITDDFLMKFDFLDENYSDSIVSLYLPRFNYNFELNRDTFRDIFINFGIDSVFSNNSNFSRIIKDSLEEDFYLSEINQKIVIDINEKGNTNSKKYNETDIDYDSLVEINFNRPFVYFIRDTINHEILFFGILYEPNIWNNGTC